MDVLTYDSADVLTYTLVMTNIILIIIVIKFAYFDKRQAEKLQKQSELYYQSLVDYNPYIVLIVDNQGKITNVNSKGIKLLKDNYEQIISRSIFSYFHDKDRLMVEDQFHDLTNTKQAKFEASIQGGEGKWIPMFITFVPIILDNKITGSFVILRDNTELIEYKERIKKAQRDLYETISRQQGMTFKYIKREDRYLYTLCEGELIYKLGFSPYEVVGKDIRDLLPEEMARKIIQVYNQAWSGKVSYYEETINGVDFYVSLSPVIINGKTIEVIGSAVDITDRKRAEKNLEENEKFFKNILMQMSEGVVLYGANDHKVALNENVYKMLGLSREEYPALTTTNRILPFIKEDGSPITLENNPINITLKTGTKIKGAVMGIKREEKTTWLSVNTKLLNQEGIPTVLMTFSDITIQKEQEIKLRESNALRRTLIDSLPFGIIVFNNNLKTVALNKPFCQIVALDEPLKNLVGRNLIDYQLTIFDDLEKEQKRIMKIVSDKEPVVDEIVTSDNRMLKRSYFPFYMDGLLKGHLFMLEDITEGKELEKKILFAKEEAEKANIAKSEFLSKMSHELRTPLNGILGFSQLLELDQTLTSQQQMFVQEILKGGRHLLSLINEILDLSRIEIGQLKLLNETLLISTAIEECISMVGPTAIEKGVMIVNDTNKCIDKYVHVDHIRLKQIIINLLDNAIKFNKKKGTVTISCELQNDSLIIHVLDTGIGIPAEEHSFIFEPFYRVENTNVDGTGIGLSLVKQLIQLMGGKIEVHSHVGEGSVFSFSFPIVDSNPKHVHPNENEMVQFPKERKNTVLYIEDNQSNIQLVSEILGPIPGVTLLTALTGKDGIKVAKDKKVDLILLDIHLPDLNGMEVLEKLKSDGKTKDIPVIAVSANAVQDHIDIAIDNGVKDYITKPFDIKYFLSVVLKYLL
jgi:PAS domain S-box-containing protein